jgi:predicted metal-dependent hydrolase
MPSAPVESSVVTQLAGGPLAYVLRRTPRSRGMRLTIHPSRGVVVSVPPATRRGWAHPESHVEAFLRDREPWIRRHLARQAAERRALAERPELGEGRLLRYRGVPHEVVVTAAAPGVRRSRVSTIEGADGPTVRLELTARDRLRAAAVLEAWLRERARAAIDEALVRHASAMGVRPQAVTVRDARSRWGSCSRAGRLSFSWRLILAAPEALESVVVHELCHLRVFGHGKRFHELLARHMPDAPRWRRWLHDHAAELHAALEPSGQSVAA